MSPIPLPRFLQIEPVGQCNLRCQMCPIQFRRDGPPHGPPAFLDFDAFTQILERFEGVEELQLQGLGEPMMHPRFFEMVAHAAGRGIRVSTNSNLTLLDARRAEACVRSGLERLHVSVDGARAATYEAIRRGARLDRVRRNIERLLAVRDRLGSVRPELSLVVVAMRQNLEELPELVRLAASWRMREIFVQHLAHDFGEESLPSHYRPMRQWVDGQTLLGEDVERVSRLFAETRAAARAAGVTVRLPSIPPRPHPPGMPGRQRCDWPWRGAYLSYQGLAMPCCMVSTPDRVNFGNMVAAGPDTIWNGPEYEQFRERLESGDPPDVCRTCSVYRGSF